MWGEEPDWASRLKHERAKQRGQKRPLNAGAGMVDSVSHTIRLAS